MRIILVTNIFACTKFGINVEINRVLHVNPQMSAGEILSFHFSQIGCKLCTFSRNKRKRQPIGMLGRSSGNHYWLLANASALAFLAVFVYATQAIAFEWKPGLILPLQTSSLTPSHHVLLRQQKGQGWTQRSGGKVHSTSTRGNWCRVSEAG